MSFYDLQVSFEQIDYAFAKKLDKHFWARQKEETFIFVGKWLDNLESREISSSKFFDYFSRSGIKNFEGMDPVFVQ